MTRGWITGSGGVARVPILAVLDRIYINSSHSNQANASNDMIWVQVSQNIGNFLPVSCVPLGKGRGEVGSEQGQKSGSILMFTKSCAACQGWGCMSRKQATMEESSHG